MVNASAQNRNEINLDQLLPQAADVELNIFVKKEGVRERTGPTLYMCRKIAYLQCREPKWCESIFLYTCRVINTVLTLDRPST